MMDEAIGLGGLFTALCEFQKECPKFEFDKTVRTGKYSFSYVQLATLIAKTKPLLAKHGLTVLQFPVSAPEGLVCVRTVIGHISGASYSEEFQMKIPGNGSPQDYGSAISYQRRYSYCAALGLVGDEDTDGHSPAELYRGTVDDIAWLKEKTGELGITDKAVQKKLHEKLLQSESVKDVKLIAKLVD